MKINRTIKGYAAMAVLLLAASCDHRNEVGADVSGETIAVEVNIAGVWEGQSEDVMRSASVSPLTGRREIAMISQPIGNGMLLDMSLEPDEASPLRAVVKVLEEGKRFRVVALKHADGTYVSHGDYVMTASGGVSPTAGDLHVPVGEVSYDYICLSYNSTTALPAASFTVGQVATLSLSPDGVGDFLYAKVADKIIHNVGEATLSFTLIHQYNHVTLMVDGGYNEWTVGSVAANKIYLKPNYQAAEMKLQDWSRQSGTEATTRYFTDWASSGTYSCTSAALKVFTAGEPIRLMVLASAVTINSQARPSVNTEVSFPALPSLAPGHNYVLRLRMRIPRWAGSNIYWVKTGTYDDDEDNVADGDVGYLTFDTEGNTTNQGYQGVYFKCGSLVGISPGQTSGSTAFSNATPVYLPSYVAGGTSTWRSPLTSPYTQAGWVATVAGTADDDPETIPYMDGSYYDANNTGRGSTYVMEMDRNTTEMYEGLRGDICQYLGKTDNALTGYRLPMSLEFGYENTSSWSGRTDGWVQGGGSFSNYTSSTTLSPSGTTDIMAVRNVAYAKNSTMGNVIFSTAGYRSGAAGGGNLGYIGWYGTHQSGSISSVGTHNYSLHFYNSDVYPHHSFNRNYACPVRCVKN
jgi:hypothetical protein